MLQQILSIKWTIVFRPIIYPKINKMTQISTKWISKRKSQVWSRLSKDSESAFPPTMPCLWLHKEAPTNWLEISHPLMTAPILTHNHQWKNRWVNWANIYQKMQTIWIQLLLKNRSSLTCPKESLNRQFRRWAKIRKQLSICLRQSIFTKSLWCWRLRIQAWPWIRNIRHFKLKNLWKTRLLCPINLRQAIWFRRKRSRTS